jgi:dTDP-4-amino-4,6-dideoxygalactose transaminase
MRDIVAKGDFVLGATVRDFESAFAITPRTRGIIPVHLYGMPVDYGDGGAIVTADPEFARRARLLRDHGSQSKYNHTVVGYCFRLDSLQAAVLGVKLRHLDEWNAARTAAAAYYDRLIGDRLERIGSQHREGAVHHIYAVRVPAFRRDRVVDALRERGIALGDCQPATC